MSEIQFQRRAHLATNLKTILLTTIIYLRIILDYAIDTVFFVFYLTKQKQVSPVSDPITLESASSIARKIRQRTVKSEDVVRAFVERLKEVNPLLNAIVDERYEQAISEAIEIDKAIADGRYDKNESERKPFLGVPFTSKESTGCKGMSWTFGLKCRRLIKATEDAYLVERMKEAGGILLGVTNIPQLNLWQETSNPLFGTTNNPYNITRNVGGSSGGEACVVAACGSPIGLGTDIGGSARIPAFMCGVFGHKPTNGLISTKGLTFRTGNEGETMVCAGPIVKHSEDLIPLVKVFLGSNVSKLNLDECVDVKRLRVYYMMKNNDVRCSPIRDEMNNAFQRVIKHYQSTLVQKPKEADFTEVQYGGRLWRYWMTQEPETNFRRDIANREKEINPYLEPIKYLIGKSDYNLAVIYNLINSILPAENAEWCKRTTDNLRSKIMSALGSDGVLLFPSAPWPASYHHTSYLRPYNFNYFSIWNALKLPVTQVPLGLSKGGMPLGIQVVAAPYCDHLCIAVARDLEETFGGYVPPFASDSHVK